MRLRSHRAGPRRRGKILVMTALLLPGVILAGLANAVDVGVIAVARNQLRTITDSAALAGVQTLSCDCRIAVGYLQTAEVIAARNRAKYFAEQNRALNATPVMLDNTANSANGDVVVGYLNPNQKATGTPNTAAVQSFNAVQVTARRTSDHGGTVPSFFGVLWRPQGWDLAVTSTAIVQVYQILGAKMDSRRSSPRVPLLPIVLDKTTYDEWMGTQLNGGANATFRATDNFAYNSSTGSVTAGQDGVYETDLYPIRTRPGNWGTINGGVTNTSTSNLSDQIRNGITPAQMATYPNSEIKLNSGLTPPQITFSGDPGISAGIKDDLIAIIGKPRIIPIYDVSDQQGNNTTYRVIGFQGVRIVDVNFRGNPKYVIIQPAFVPDTNAVIGQASSNWTTGGCIRTYLCR